MFDTDLKDTAISNHALDEFLDNINVFTVNTYVKLQGQQKILTLDTEASNNFEDIKIFSKLLICFFFIIYSYQFK